MFKGRPVIEIMVLAFTVVVAVSILALGAGILYVEIRTNGAANTDRAVDALLSLLTAILGALLGLIAGRTRSDSPAAPPDDEHPNIS
jgi:hypothetical protein